MNRKSTSVSSVAGSALIPLNPWAENLCIGLYATRGDSSTFSIQVTSDDLRDGTPSNWWDLTNWTGLTANKAGLLDFPATAVRINQTVGTGTTTLVVIESP
jgi:hypothetical protein